MYIFRFTYIYTFYVDGWAGRARERERQRHRCLIECCVRGVRDCISAQVRGLAHAYILT